MAEKTLVTPEMAAEWLTLNKCNRPLNRKIASDYARDMEAGNWVYNGEAIKFGIGSDGLMVLLDGQHRLAAIVESGATVETLVVFDLAQTTQATMDAGRKRSMSDQLTLAGVTHAAVVASIAKRGVLWDQGDRKFSNNFHPTVSEMNDFIAANPGIHRSAEVAQRTRQAFRPIPQSAAGIAHLLFSRLDAGETAEFFAQLQTGANLTEGNPILALRNRYMLDASVGKAVPTHVRIGVIVKAWNFLREGKESYRINMPVSDSVPEPK